MAPRSPLVHSISAQPIALPSELLQLAESQWIFTEAELSRAPSILEGCPEMKERENRTKGVNFILQVGIMLKLPQITLSSASVFLHRFYMRHSMVTDTNRSGYHYYPIAATCLFLATKVEENCRKMRELVIACVKVAQKDPNKIVDEQDREYWRWKDNILLYEDLLMEALCFDFSLESPYKVLYELLLRFNAVDNKKLRNAAWAFINDSCMTVMCLLFPSRTVAAGALYAATKHCDASFPNDEYGRSWWDIAGVSLPDIRKACNFMADIYQPAHASRPGNHSINYENLSENVMRDTILVGALGEGPKESDSQEGKGTNGYKILPATGTGTGILTGTRYRDDEVTDAGRQGLDNHLDIHSNGISGSKAGTFNVSPHNVHTNGGAGFHEQPLSQQPHGPGLDDVDNGGGLVSPRIEEVSEEGEVED